MKILHIPTGQICYWSFENESCYNCIITKKSLKNLPTHKDPRKIEISSVEFDILCKQSRLVIYINNEIFINNYYKYKSLDLLEFTLIE